MNPKTFLSLGAGVQSTTLALLIARGDLPMVDGAIFADTQNEPDSVYRHLEKLEKALPFPVYRVTHGNLRTDSLQKRVSVERGKKYVKNSVPFWIRAPDGSMGTILRKCTLDYKIVPIQRQMKALCEIPPGRLPLDVRAVSLIGISRDEAIRMKPSNVAWIKNHWPLIELGMTRNDCLRWLSSHGWSAPRSACSFCPYHSNTEWQRLKTDEPEAFAAAVSFEKEAQEAFASHDEIMVGIPYLSQQLIPLGEIDFTEAKSPQMDLFGNDCAGICGV